MTLTSKPNYEPHFIKYATTLYNEVPKPIQEAEKYCAVVPKLKGICLTKHKHAHYQIEKKKKKNKKRKKREKKMDLKVICGKKNVELLSCPT